MDRGAWGATVHGIGKSRTQLSDGAWMLPRQQTELEAGGKEVHTCQSPGTSLVPKLGWHRSVTTSVVKCSQQLE